ncbi:Conserved_hypothetical protein [Hexamita inflata]|uniref:Uncharacterized protein n=1 Tax=Hexamita inflata TaxID=28002 RepID=A0AA86Q6P0_9EUKA|nr:Conserved hypothetical protein [Hexamita inflata]
MDTLDMNETYVIDLHPLQHLNKLETIYAYKEYKPKNPAYNACIIDVSPLSKLTQLKELYFAINKITNVETLKHHKNFSKYHLYEKVPTTDELKFYTKILSVHSSNKQIRKIQAENRASKIKESMSRQREYVNLNINEQIRALNMKIEIWAQFIQNSDADQ